MVNAKPPLGIMPRWLHTEKRMWDILQGIERYMSEAYPIPDEWMEELSELQKLRNSMIENKKVEVAK